MSDSGKPVFRYDRGTFARPVKTASGFLRCDATLSRSGVLEYRMADGRVRREFRPPEEAFRDETMQSHAMVPVVLGHPVEGRLTPNNAKMLSVGAVGDSVRREDNMVAAPVVITDANAIHAVEEGRATEVSCGYRCFVEETPGITPDGERYDAVQRRIVIDHAALVPKGRAGSDVRLHLDAADAVMTDPSEGAPMPGDIQPTANAPFAHDLVLTNQEPPISSGTGPTGGEDLTIAIQNLTKATAERHDAFQKLSAARLAYEQARGDSAKEKAHQDAAAVYDGAQKGWQECRAKLEASLAAAEKAIDRPVEANKGSTLGAMGGVLEPSEKHDSISLPSLDVALPELRSDALDPKMSMDELRKQLRAVLTVPKGDDPDAPRPPSTLVEDVWPDHCVFLRAGKLYSVKFDVQNGNVALIGLATEVRQTYETAPDGESVSVATLLNRLDDMAQLVLPQEPGASDMVTTGTENENDPWWLASKAGGHAGAAHRASMSAHQSGSHVDAAKMHRDAAQAWKAAASKGHKGAEVRAASHEAFARAHELAAQRTVSSPV